MQIVKENFMKSTYIYLIGLFFLVCSVSVKCQLDSLEVLFLGNSFISKNYLPAIFQSLSNAQGKHPHVDNYTPLGYTLQQHSEDSITLDKISMIDWDIIILQEQGQIPSYDPGRDTLMYPYAVMLDSFIHACHPCAKTLFFLT